MVGRLFYLIHLLAAANRAAKRFGFGFAFASSLQGRSSHKIPRKPKYIFHVPRHCERKVRHPPRPGKTQAHPLRPAIVNKAEEWEEYVPDYFPHFLQLPLEIREKVYHYAMDGLSSRYFVQAYKDISPLTVAPATLPNLCFASKQLHKEGLAVWIRRTRFTVLKSSITHVVPLMNFLSAVHGFKHVRMLCYGDLLAYGLKHQRVYITTGEDLAAKCIGLRSLIFELDYFWLTDFARAPAPVKLGPKKEVKKRLRLEPVYQLTSLRKLKIEVVVPWSRGKRFEQQGGLTRLTEIVTEGFEAAGRGGAVEVQLEMVARRLLVGT
ncbi:hypothetical protein J4E85_004205 [Alternaria conjuncta]|uniref:uncharacterized protein n=1 Tax=Alternaria conjuncta TaxID=181017 RepID=UPI00221E3A84|nr:uncharacterized protein J4E85_004205 [Alternaria conjuncta]KAI4931611.1 hypothetical protein J4E85_004205 [Alternaria conjuncta]